MDLSAANLGINVRVTLKLKGTLLVTKELEPDILSMAFLMTV